MCPPVPIDEIIELHLKLEFGIRDLQRLFGFDDVHGAIWFRDRLIDDIARALSVFDLV